MECSFKGHRLKICLWKAYLFKWLSIHHVVLHSEGVASEDLLLALSGKG